MKLASALKERSDINTRIQELSVRLVNNSKVQEGDKPAENPDELLKEMDSLFERLQYLITHINMTNSLTELKGKTLTELLSERDVLSKKLSVLRSFLNSASEKVNRYSRTEIRIESSVNVAELQKTVDSLSKELRTLDEAIQEANWTTELK
ncbi:MAG: DIP1984 family protein [Clostridia bacterium]|nr:DIP1984 family protein [Clostridia bacterium]